MSSLCLEVQKFFIQSRMTWHICWTVLNIYRIVFQKNYSTKCAFGLLKMVDCVPKSTTLNFQDGPLGTRLYFNSVWCINLQTSNILIPDNHRQRMWISKIRHWRRSRSLTESNKRFKATAVCNNVRSGWRPWISDKSFTWIGTVNQKSGFIQRHWWTERE